MRSWTHLTGKVSSFGTTKRYKISMIETIKLLTKLTGSRRYVCKFLPSTWTVLTQIKAFSLWAQAAAERDNARAFKR